MEHTGVAVPCFERKGDIMNCGIHRGVRLQEHAMENVEKVLEKHRGRI